MNLRCTMAAWPFALSRRQRIFSRVTENLMQNRLFSTVRESCAKVAERARYVKIDRQFLSDYARSLPVSEALNPVMDTENHFCEDPETMLVYFLVLDCINFGSGWFSSLNLESGMNNGYFTIASRLKNDFIARGCYQARFLQKITAEDCSLIFKQDKNSAEAGALMAYFAAALNAFGDFLTAEFAGSCSRLVAAAGCSAAALAEILLKMPFYRDCFLYEDIEVFLLKRAQITASDLHIAFSGQSYGRFDDIGELTIFADNLVPHVLQVDGLLTYEKSLAERISAGIHLESGSAEEIELRACSVHAVELLRGEYAAHGVKITSQGLDYLLWNRGLALKYSSRPSHVTRCVYY